MTFEPTLMRSEKATTKGSSWSIVSLRASLVDNGGPSSRLTEMKTIHFLIYISQY